MQFSTDNQNHRANLLYIFAFCIFFYGVLKYGDNNGGKFQYKY